MAKRSKSKRRRKASKRKPRRQPKKKPAAITVKRLKSFALMTKLFRKYSLPGGFKSRRWKELPYNKMWEKPDLRKEFMAAIDKRFFGKTRLNARIIQSLYTNSLIKDEAKSRSRYIKGLRRLSNKWRLKPKKVDKILRSDLRTVANRMELFEKEMETVDRRWNELESKINPKHEHFSPQKKKELMLTRLSLGEVQELLIAANLSDALGHSVVNWAGLSREISNWFKEQKPLGAKKKLRRINR